MANKQTIVIRVDESLVHRMDSLKYRVSKLQMSGNVSRNWVAVESLLLGVERLAEAVEAHERKQKTQEASDALR